MVDIRNKVVAGLLSAAVAAALTGCGGEDSGSEQAQGSPQEVDDALQKGGELTVWGWEPTLKQAVAGFQKKYPKVKVKLVNSGTSNDQYTALQNAIKAEKGVPDVAQIEYSAVPQFALSKQVTDVSGYASGDLSKTYTPGPWASVKRDGGVYGLPMDSGPMAMFYNKKVFDKHGLSVPKTWDEYVAVAKKLHQADPKAYITADSGDAGFVTSMIWQAGGRPFTGKGEQARIDLQDKGSRTFATQWQKLIDGKLLSPTTAWSDEWYKGLGDGTIATLTSGAWMPANFASGVAGAKGDWRVAPMPQWKAGANVTAENGGSSLAMPAASSQKALAYGFMRYVTTGEGAQTRVDNGAFPATTAQLTSPEFVNKRYPYFGGQKINQVLADSAQHVGKGWQYLPYQVYGNSVFNDTAGKAYVSDQTLAKGFGAWQSKLVGYGKEQGFDVQE